MRKTEEKHLEFLEKIEGVYQNRYSEKQLLDQLKRAKKILGDSFNSRTYVILANNNHEFVTLRTIHRYFGSWNNALEKAGLPILRRQPYRSKYTPEVCINHLVNVTEVLGHFPTTIEYDEIRRKVGTGYMPSLAHVRAQLKSWPNAIKLTKEAIERKDAK